MLDASGLELANTGTQLAKDETESNFPLPKAAQE